MRKFSIYGLLITLIFGLAACGGGGGGGSISSPNAEKPLKPNTAVISVSSTGVLPEGTSIGSAGVVIELPEGATVRQDETGAIETGVIAVSGVASGKAVVGLSIYEPAAEGKKGRLYFTVLDPERKGFGIGEFARVTFDIAAESQVTGDDFVLVQPSEFFNLSPLAAIPTLEASLDSVVD